MKVKGAQSCLTLFDPRDYTVHGILQARILESVAFPFSRDLPNPGIKPRFSTLQAGLVVPSGGVWLLQKCEDLPSSSDFGVICNHPESFQV